MADNDMMAKSLTYISKSDQTLPNLESYSDSGQTTLFSLSTNIHRCSDLAETNNSQVWTSSLDSLNHYRSNPSMSSIIKDDISMARTLIEEEKEDDLDRDQTMEIEQYSPDLPSRPRLRKRMSLYMLKEDEEFQRNFQQNKDFLQIAEEGFLEMRKSNSICMPKRLSKIRKLKSEIYSDMDLMDSQSSVCSSKQESPKALRDKTNSNAFLKNRLSPRKNKSFKNIFMSKEIDIQNTDFTT